MTRPRENEDRCPNCVAFFFFQEKLTFHLICNILKEMRFFFFREVLSMKHASIYECYVFAVLSVDGQTNTTALL
jgi:hypothetical protein